MPELHKTREQAPKISHLSLLKARIVDRIHRHKEKDKKIDHKPSNSSKEVKKVAPKPSATPEKKSTPTAKPVTKEPQRVIELQKPTQGTKRPIDQILVGSWNALKQIPEKQGKGIINLYDKLRFSKLTSEEQKVQDKVHVFLKKYQKEIGWGVTGVEAAAVTYGVVKGFQYLKNRKLRKQMMRDLGMGDSGKARVDENSSPQAFQQFVVEESLRGASKPVRKSVLALNEFLKKPRGADDPFGELPENFIKVAPIFAAKFYGFAEAHNVANLINPLPDYDAQHEKIMELLKQFFTQTSEQVKTTANRLGNTEEEASSVNLQMMLVGILLDGLGFPGLEELGVRFKPKPME